jgi:carboxymethylenebutenolidase
VGEMIEIEALDGEGRFAAYRAMPETSPRGGVIVIQEIFGVNEGIRAKADEWAALGYLALAPDMFWRFAPGYEKSFEVEAERADAFEVRKQFDLDRSARDVEACLRAARLMLGQGKVGVIGYCMGGSVAYLAATRTDADAAVGYYGAQIPSRLGEAHAIARPLMLHFGAADDYIDADARAAVHAALDGNDLVTIHEDYPEAGHGFADHAGSRRDGEQAERADARTAAFLKEALA